ncbi:hypothetical protein GCM10023085_70050 [Actinomadura viridis]|uniref:AAA+ ATPase domain-containing protein n=1 Tax=Actinomadura viridis TaxID=58110 RepID=A0A931GRV4_9ACTN|nr:ATP-binding protein [Actinomadura viridis]MBG6090139.1 hypothetical protein [Actinomadura viridis]
MPKSFTFNEAVRLLGGQEHPVVRAIDRVTGPVMLALGASGVQEILSWFDPRLEFVRSSHLLINDIQERMGPARGRDRTEILAATHSILVITAYFDVFKSASLPFNPRKLKLDKAEQLTLITGEVVESSSARDLLGKLLDAELPLPTPYEPREVIRERLYVLYHGLSQNLNVFLTGLALWDGMDETERDRLWRNVNEIPEHAVRRYVQLLRETAVHCPEFLVWASLQDHEATRNTVAEAGERIRIPLQRIHQEMATVTSGLSRMERLITQHSGQVEVTGVLASLATGYRAALTRPIVETTPVEAEALSIPDLGEGYIDPCYRVRPCNSDDRPAEESWWEEQPVRRDLPAFLAGFFTSPRAADAPLIVLGQPGSGKSVLTRILAARLPAEDFAVVRVELRAVPANAPVQEQIENAIHLLTGEHVGYPSLVRSAGGAIPVILLDGFDELLQSTGVSRSNYLEQVREFQRREADLGRPVVVVVTTRTVVAERARFPDATVVLRLEPFAEEQISDWLAVWNHRNQAAFLRRSIRPLTSEDVLRHHDLAAQPLLLLMLALYDADANALSSTGTDFRRTTLYEGLLKRFVRRELVKHRPELSPARMTEETELELERLGIVAFAMFNRGRQAVREDDLDQDMRALLDQAESHRGAPLDLDERLTPAQLVVGRFFFIHESQASFRESRTRTYEFLHSTFSEYLTSRLIGKEIQRLVRLYEAGGLTAVRRGFARLRALVSFAPLTMRGPVVDFLGEIFGLFGETAKSTAERIIGDLIKGALLPEPPGALWDYAPVSITVTEKHAALSVNAVLLGLICAGGEATVSELFDDPADRVDCWRRHATLWKSQLPPEGWDSVLSRISVTRGSDNGHREVILALRRGDVAKPINLEWTFDIRGEASEEQGPFDLPDLLLDAAFLCDRTTDLAVGTLDTVPMLLALSRFPSTFRRRRVVTEAQLSLLLALPGEHPRATVRAACHALLSSEVQRYAVIEQSEPFWQVLKCYRESYHRERALFSPDILLRISASSAVTADGIVQAVDCALDEWKRSARGEWYEKELARFLEQAVTRLYREGDDHHLLELWVILMESGLPLEELAPQLTDPLQEMERIVTGLDEHQLPSSVPPQRLERALRLRALG